MSKVFIVAVISVLLGGYALAYVDYGAVSADKCYVNPDAIAACHNNPGVDSVSAGG